MQTLIQKLKIYNNVRLSILEIESLKKYAIQEMFKILESHFKDENLHIQNNFVVRDNISPIFIDDYRIFITELKDVIQNAKQSDIEISKFGDHSVLFDDLCATLDELKY